MCCWHGATHQLKVHNGKIDIIDDVLSLNNSVDRIYPIENEIKDTTERDRSGSCLDVHLEIDNEGRLSTQLYDTRDDINVPIVNLFSMGYMRSTELFS
jgi:hypothetical protein